VAYSPDGERIVTASDDGTARLWDATSAQEVLVLSGNRRSIGAVAFSSDGKQIVTGSDDQTAHVWRAAHAGQVTAWQEDEGKVAQKLAALQRVRPDLVPFNAVATTATAYLAQLERAPTAEEERQQVARANDVGAIKQWLVLAPVPLPTNQTYSQSFLEGLDAEQIAGEGQLKPKEGERSLLAGGELTWQQLAQKDHVIDFIALVGRVTERSVGYAVCYLHSEQKQSGLRLLVGSDSGVKVYLNGTRVHEYRFGRGFDPDHDVVDGITLNAGLNVVVCKTVITARASRWRNSFRFTDANGEPLQGIRVTLSP
jgi:hypothetical protein